jgi:hypothetical protein
MHLLKSVLVIALLTAAVVLFPLRRAQAAFAARQAGAVAANSRKPARRRLLAGGAIVQASTHSPLASRSARGSRREVVQSAVRLQEVAALQETMKSAPHAAGHLAGSPADGAQPDGTYVCCDPLVDCVVTVPQPEQLTTVSPSPDPAAAHDSVPSPRARRPSGTARGRNRSAYNEFRPFPKQPVRSA